VALLSVLACAGCTLAGLFSPRERGLVFSHRIHVQEEELACVSCHESAEVEETPGMPAPDSCAVCHDELDAEKPAERRVATLFYGATFQSARASALGDEVVFDHLKHVTALQDCGACHVGIEKSEAVGAAIAVDMQACTRCHEQRALPNDCATCHSYVRRDWAPASHELDWQHLHGRASRRTDPAPADDCFLCHQPSTCESCHRLEPPASHDQNFRLRGHAILAAVDRNGCATCHESATCDRCHAEVLPLSHRGATWGSRRNTHCLTCHFPLESASCRTCHRSTPSHALGPPKPDWHDAAMNCRGCHTTTLPLSHVDDGSNCNLCHP